MTEEILFSSLLRDTSQSVIPRKINTDRLHTLFYNSKNSMLQFHKGYKNTPIKNTPLYLRKTMFAS